MNVFFRTAALFTAFSIPLASGCNNEKPEITKKQEVKSSTVKPIDVNLKNTIDEKRKTLEKKEREFASELGGFASCELPNVLIHLYMVLDNKDEILKARDIAFKIIKRREDFIQLTGNDFLNKTPNEEQLEAFNRVINMAQKGMPLTWGHSTISLKEISKDIEGYLQKTHPELKGEKLKEEVKHYLDYFKEYQEALKKIRSQRNDLFVSMRDFNNEAKKIGEPTYNPVWGLSLERVQDITIFVSRKGEEDS